MPIDKAMLGAVRHYLMGTVAVARSIHGEMQAYGRSADYPIGECRTLGDEIDTAKQKFLSDCIGMLEDPVPETYAHVKDYHLSAEDRDFLTKLFRSAEEVNWRNPKEIDRLKSDINVYAPHHGFGSS